MADVSSLRGIFENGNASWCYSYDDCLFNYAPCEVSEVHYDLRYNDASAAWVLIASIIVFFMKAGFMLLEVSFARTVKEKRTVIIIKHQDAFASAFGFFLLGFDVISRYSSPQSIPLEFFGITDPVLWFFKFTFASNAATIIGGCLVTNKYKLRLPAAFISAFVISGIIHPIVARIIWSDECNTLSPYRFCQSASGTVENHCKFNCTDKLGLADRLYVLDFAGGGAVHLLGGMAGLMVCLFAKFQEWKDKRKEQFELRDRPDNPAGVEQQEQMQPEGFWDWMYPVHGGEETVSEAALGVIILWFCWFAFNCGSTESVEIGRKIGSDNIYPFYGIPSVIAVNMIMSVAAGGTTAVLIATWAQVRFRTESVNANEIANGILSALVAITAGCPFVDYWGACLIGVIGVLLYHVGCYLEYKLGIKDTARVVPVHGVCGLWSMIAVAVFQIGTKADCNLHAAFEGLCYCKLRLPPLNYGERLLAQIVGAVAMIGISVTGTFLMYFLLYIIPIKPFIWLFERLCCLNPRKRLPPLRYVGGWLLTHPDEEFQMQDMPQLHARLPSESDSESPNMSIARKSNTKVQADLPVATGHSNMGTHQSHYGTISSHKGTSTYTSTAGSDPPSNIQTGSGDIYKAPLGGLGGLGEPRKKNYFDLKHEVLLEQMSSEESDENL